MLNSEAREELDAYGDHLQVVIEDANGNLFEVAEITSYSRPSGVVVTFVLGGKADV